MQMVGCSIVKMSCLRSKIKKCAKCLAISEKMLTFASKYYICIREYRLNEFIEIKQSVGFQHVILKNKEGTSPSAYGESQK